ncbi:MAG: FadR/GntR family transcriptional regulator [Pseudoclavibacter sp.]
MVRLGNAVLALDEDAASVADAIRIRNALELLLVEDALVHATREDVLTMREKLAAMRSTADESDGTGFIRANWALHGQIAATSPNTMLRSIYVGLLEVLESHTLSATPPANQSRAAYLQSRYDLHVELVDAIADQDETRALDLIREHNATNRIDPASDSARLDG